MATREAQMANSEASSSFPVLRQTVIDGTDIRTLAEFYRQLLGFSYRPGDEPPTPGAPDTAAEGWVIIRHPSGMPRLAFQKADDLPAPTWPDDGVAQQMHLDFTVGTVAELDAQHDRALRLGARLLQDRADDPQEPLRVYADPAGHPFCIFVAPA
jgi:hypothetical protein